MLFQFQGSDVVAVVRVEGQHQLKIIRRAVLANDTYVEIQKCGGSLNGLVDKQPRQMILRVKSNPTFLHHSSPTLLIFSTCIDYR